MKNQLSEFLYSTRLSNTATSLFSFSEGFGFSAQDEIQVV